MLPLRRVLLADDDLEVRSGVVDLLMPLGVEVLEAESGLEVLEIVRVRQQPVHLLLLDMHMPGCSGLEVLERLRQPPAVRVPCIFYSGEATDEVERLALAAGARAFLRKPVQPDRLRGEVLLALQRYPDTTFPTHTEGLG